MNRIEHATATPEGLFTDGNPAEGVPATVVPAKFLNDVQEEIIAVIAEAEIDLDGEDQTQLLQALAILIANGLDIFGASHEWAKVQSYAQTDLAITDGAVTWDLRYPNALLVLTQDVTSFMMTNPINGTTPMLTILQDSTGTRTCAMPSGIRWAGKALPELTMEPYADDLLAFPIRSSGVIRGYAALNFGTVE